MGIPEENVFLIQIPKKELFAFLGNNIPLQMCKSEKHLNVILMSIFSIYLR